MLFRQIANLPKLQICILSRAEAAVAGDPLRQSRVAKIRLSTRWVRMKNKQMREGYTDPSEVNQFFTDWRAHGLTRIDEWVNTDGTLRALLEGKWRGTEFLNRWDDEAREIL